MVLHGAGSNGGLIFLRQVRLWNRMRSSAEIGSNFNRPLAGNEEGLVGLFRMNDGSGSNLTDSSPLKNHAECTNVGAWVTGGHNIEPPLR